MNDRELLELAAKAASIKGVWAAHYAAEGYPHDFVGIGRSKETIAPLWNALTDDGDALRLAMHLELGVVCKHHSDPYEKNISVVTNPYCVNQIRITEPHRGDPESATRRAIVRAAAEIGKAMP